MLETLLQQLPFSYTNSVVAVGSAVVGMLAGVVGCLALLRRRSLVGDAMSHAALPGVCLAFLLSGGSRAPTTLLMGAMAAGLVAAILIVLMERYTPVSPDAAIGVTLSVSFSLGIVLLTLIAQRPNADQAGLDHYLFGQAAGLLVSEVRVMLTMAASAILLVVLLRIPIRATLFDRGFARSVGVPTTAVDILCTTLLVVAAVTGLQVVGAILMVALLVAPGLAARQWCRRLSSTLILSAIFGAAIGAVGAILAAQWDTPTGPMIVIVAFISVTLSLILAPRRGLIAQNAIRRRNREMTAL